MAYRRRQGITRSSTFKEEIYQPPPDAKTTDNNKSSLTPSYSFSPSSSNSSSSSSTSLAAQAIRASAAHREVSSLSSAYAADSDHPRSKGFTAYENASSRSDSKGFWGVLARKAKAILEEDDLSQQFDQHGKSRWQMPDSSAGDQFQQQNQTSEAYRKMDNPSFRRGLDRLTSSLNQIGDTFEKAFEEGRTIVENKTADIIQETRKLQMRRKGNEFEEQSQISGANSSWQPLTQLAQPQNHETQLKASRDVAMATAAKAKLLLRELKTVKADLAFAKARCSQLEEENKRLRDSREKGQNPADDDLIRLQLETLLAEKARLAHENSVYARENRFLREIVEYHQLTMQDVVYVDEGSEEVTEVYPYSIPSVSRMLSVSPTSPTSPSSPSNISPSMSPPVLKEMVPVPISAEATDSILTRDVPPSSSSRTPEEFDEKRPSLKVHKEDDEKRCSSEVHKEDDVKRPSDPSA